MSRTFLDKGQVLEGDKVSKSKLIQSAVDLLLLCNILSHGFPTRLHSPIVLFPLE